MPRTPGPLREMPDPAFPARREAVLGMLDRHRAGKAEFSLYVWTIYNAVAWFDYWVDGGREVRVA